MKLLQSLSTTIPKAVAILAVSAHLISCDTSTGVATAVPAANAACDPGSAQIEIGDGFQEIVCGCNEPAGQLVGPGGSPAPITCTVAVGTEIFFHYVGTHLLHQIVPVDGVSFPASPLSDPSFKVPVTVHGFPLSVAGTYDFVDAFDRGITGHLIAQ